MLCKEKKMCEPLLCKICVRGGVVLKDSRRIRDDRQTDRNTIALCRSVSGALEPYTTS